MLIKTGSLGHEIFDRVFFTKSTHKNNRMNGLLGDEGAKIMASNLVVIATMFFLV